MTELNTSNDFLWLIDRIGDQTIIDNLENERNEYNYVINNNMITTTLYNNTFDDSIFDEFVLYYNDVDSNLLFSDPKILEIVIDENMEVTEEQYECCVCMTEREKVTICKLNCMHTFCNICSVEILKKNHNCPLCRTNINKICVQSEEIKANFDEFTKMI
jgi:hypothetical protein